MADNNLNINITTNADKSKVVELSEAVKELKIDAEATSESMEELSNSTDDVNGEGLSEVSSEADDASNSLDNASSSAEDVASSVADIDGSSLSDTSDMASDADGNLSSASESAEQVSVSISNIDPSVIEQIALAAGSSADEMGRLKDNATETSDSMSMIDAMATASLSGAVTSGFMSASDAAGNYSDTMVRLGYAMSGTSMSAQEAESTYGTLISSMSDQTGRGAGAVRAHLINMGNAGITSQKTLQDSFNGISKAAFQMGGDIDSMEQKFQTMVLSGNAGSRQLKQFGLNVEDLAEVMNVSSDEVSEKFKSMTEDQRAGILSSALNMKYGEEVTNNYKNSYEHLMDTLERAKDYLIRVAGEALLPVLIPAVQSAANVLNFLAVGFRGLPAPIKGIIGGLAGLIAGFTAVGLGISAVTKFIKVALAPFRTLMNLFTGDNLAKLGTFATRLKEVGLSALRAGYNALRSAAMWVVQKAQLLATSVASGLATVKNWALAISEWAVASPIMIIIIAVLALIAVLGYLYFNNEQVRQAIDGLGQAFIQAGQLIYTAFVGAIQWIIGALQNLWNYIITLGGLLPANVSITGNQILDTVIRVMAFIATLPMQLGMLFINIIAKTLGFGNNFVQNLLSAGSRSVSNFMSQISQLPSRLMGELNSMLSAVGQWAATLPQKFWDAGVNAVKNFLSALGIASPGTMQRMMVWEVSEMGRRVPEEGRNLVRNLSYLGEDAVKSFGTPKLNNVEFGEVEGGDLSFNNSKLENVMSRAGTGENKTFNITLNVGSVDKQERIDEIIDTLHNYFLWDNTTAGRTV